MTSRVPDSYSFAYEDNGFIIANVNNLDPSTTVNAKINFYDADNNKFSYPLVSAKTNPAIEPLSIMDPFLLNGTQLPSVLPLTTPLVTTTGDNSSLPSPPVKTTYLYNYWNNDTVTYPLVRLYGNWAEQASGNITVTLNGAAQGINWAFYNNEFKLYVKLSSSANPNGRNDIVLTSGGVSKNLTLYFNKPSTSGTTPHVKCFLYDTVDGSGTCDAPPGRTDNTLNDNKQRLQLDMMLIQSFLAESLRSAREHQEGIIGLPYTTFAMELDNTDTPEVYYLKSTDPTLTKEYIRTNNRLGDTGGDARLRAEFNLPIGDVTYITSNLGHIFCVGYTLISHKVPETGQYYGGVAQGGNGRCFMNSANLIWHPKTLNEFQSCWNDTTSIVTAPISTYIEFDAANNIADSCARIIGTLAHEATHALINSDHPIDLIVNARSKPMSYTFCFNQESYDSDFGIESSDATLFRYWVMSYNYDTPKTPISRVLSELGPSQRGWWMPYCIQGYVSNYNAPFLASQRSSMTPTNSSPTRVGRTGYRYSKVLQPHAKESAIQSYTLPGYYNVPIPSDLSTGYIVANIWGAGGQSAPNTSLIKPGGAGGFIRASIPIKANDKIVVTIGNQRTGGGGLANPQSGGPYGGQGGGATVLSVNDIPYYIASGGGGGGSHSPGLSSLQQRGILRNEEGENGVVPSQGQYNFDTHHQAGCGGGGWYGGNAGKTVQTLGGGGGSGLSFCRKQIGGASFEKAAVPASYSDSWVRERNVPTYTTPAPCMHIPLNIYDTNPINVASSDLPGCVKLLFVYTSYAKNNDLLNLRSSVPASVYPTTNTSDAPSFRTLIPRPNSYVTTGNTCVLNKSATPIVVASAFETHASALIADLQKFGVTASYTVGTSAASSNSTPPILLKLDPTLIDTDNKYYKHTCLIEQGMITISAANMTGISFGTSTIIQLLRNNNTTVSLGTCSIEDYSTCHRNSIMIDPARQNYNADEICHLIDLCRFYKIRFIHSHATDTAGFFLPWRPTDGVISALDSTELTAHLTKITALETLYTTVKNYGDARGVHIIPEFSLSSAHWSGFFKNTFTYYPTATNLTALLDVLDKISDFFNTSPYFHIGNDEGVFRLTTDTTTQTGFANTNKINPTNTTDYFYFKMWEKLTSKGKTMITWGGGNTNFTGTDGTVYNTGNNIAYQIWLINGGKSGSTHFPREREDYSKNDIHGESLYTLSQGIPVVQSPWRPRIHSSMKAMYDWSVAGQIATVTDDQLTDDLLHAAYPLPVTPKLLGSETLLWEIGYNLRFFYFRYKAPMRIENSHSFGKPTTSIDKFASAFDYLDRRFIELTSGVRIIESGVVDQISERIKMRNDDSSIPSQIIRDTGSISFVVNNPGHKVYYVLTTLDFPTTYTRYTPGSPNSKAILYSSPIQLNSLAPEAINGFIILRAQVYNASDVPVGPLINRKYIIRHFKVNIAGCMPKNQNFEVDKSDLTIDTGTRVYYFNERATINVSDVIPSGVIRYAIGDKLTTESPILTSSEQLVITGTVPKIVIGCFKNGEILSGNVASYNLLYTGDTLLPVNLKLPPFSLSKTPKPSFSLTRVFNTPGTQTIQLASLLTGVLNCPGGVKITAIVVGAGGSTVAGGWGGGSGGATVETYYDIERIKNATIKVGNLANKSSSVSFAFAGEILGRNGASYFPPGIDRDSINAYQDAIYPTIANGGTNGTISAAGTQGTVTKGDAAILTAATSSAGGAGYVYGGLTYGNGAYGATAAGNGLVVLTLEPL
jgi:hypothetical protein